MRNKPRDEKKMGERKHKKQEVLVWVSCCCHSVSIVFISSAYFLCCFCRYLSGRAAMKPGRGQQTGLWEGGLPRISKIRPAPTWGQRSTPPSWFADDEALYSSKQGRGKPCLEISPVFISSSSKAMEPWSTALPAWGWWEHGDTPPPAKWKGEGGG